MSRFRRAYLVTLPARLSALRAAAAELAGGSGDGIETVRQLAHSLRGSAGTFGFPALSASALAVEEAEPSAIAAQLDLLIVAVAAELAAVGTPFRLLLVSADAELGARARTELANETRRIEQAASAERAFGAFAEGAPDLVLLDLLLPDADGRELLARWRGDPARRDLPLFVLALRGGEPLRTECLALGADDYFERPGDLAALAERIDGELQRRCLHSARAGVDPLTGLANRAGFVQAVEARPAEGGERDARSAVALLEVVAGSGRGGAEGRAITEEALALVGARLAVVLRGHDAFGGRWQATEIALSLHDLDPRSGAILLDAVLAEAAAELARRQAGASVELRCGIARDEGGRVEALVRARRQLAVAWRANDGRVAVEPEPDQRPGRALLASRDREFAARARAILEADGVEVEHAFLPLSALERLDGGGIGALVVDLRPGDGEGLELLRACRVPAIAVAGSPERTLLEQAFALGVADFLLWPGGELQLGPRVRRQLRLAALAPRGHE